MKHRSVAMAATWWCMASFIYYHRPHLSPIFTDAEFDELNAYLKEHVDEVISNGYGHGLVTPERLQAGSGYDIREGEFPLICRRNAVIVSQTGEKY